MKVVIFVLILTMATWAKDDKDPAHYPLKAHLISTETTISHAGGNTSTYNSATGQWSHGHVNSNSIDRRSEFQIDNIIYVSDGRCKEIVAGTDYPARLEKDRLFVLANERVCKMRVTGTREAGK